MVLSTMKLVPSAIEEVSQKEINIEPLVASRGQLVNNPCVNENTLSIVLLEYIT